MSESESFGEVVQFRDLSRKASEKQSVSVDPARFAEVSTLIATLTNRDEATMAMYRKMLSHKTEEELATMVNTATDLEIKSRTDYFRAVIEELKDRWPSPDSILD